MRHFICPTLAAVIIVMSGCGGGGGGSSVTVTPDDTTPVISSVTTSELSTSRLMTITAMVTDPGGVSSVVAVVQGGPGVSPTSVVKDTAASTHTVTLTGPSGGGEFTGTVDLVENGSTEAIPVTVTITATDSTPHSATSTATTEIPTSPPPASP